MYAVYRKVSQMQLYYVATISILREARMHGVKPLSADCEFTQVTHQHMQLCKDRKLIFV